MSLYQPVCTAAIKTLFSEEVTHLGGMVVNAFDDGARLFLRATMSQYREVGREDALQRGVALRVLDEEVRVHPYVFRLICKNGAIMAHALETRQMENRGVQSAEMFSAELAAAIQHCGSEEAFSRSTEEIRSSKEIDADLTLNLMPLLTNVDTELPAQVAMDMLLQFTSTGDHSRFNLMNAFTAAARDVDDPELRWNLEEWGGGIAVGLTPKPVRDAGAASSLEEARREWYLERRTDAIGRELVSA